MEDETVDRLFDQITIFNFAALAHITRALAVRGVLDDAAINAIHAHLLPVVREAENCDPDSPVSGFLDSTIALLPPKR